MTPPITVSHTLTNAQMKAIRRETIFSCCKWDPQIEDTSALADFTLSLSSDCWRDLEVMAEALYRETLQAEDEVARTPSLIKLLCLPAPLESVLLANAQNPASGLQLRVMRFDFHPTNEGWRISEVNSDVPGGYIEAAGFSSIMARHFPGCTLTADPVEILVAALRRHHPSIETVGLVHATAYTDDRQVMVFLQRAFQRAGINSQLLSPADVDWQNGGSGHNSESLSALLRFFPAEWLPNLSGNTWKPYFQSTRCTQINPGQAILSQSKRFPLTWPHLKHASPTNWSKLLPETISSRPNLNDDWVLKPALGRVGEGVGLSGVTTARDWTTIRKALDRKPNEWVAQRRFPATSYAAPSGTLYPCLGVYVIDGQAAGIYGRIARRPLIDHLAQDVAVLVAPAAMIEQQALVSA